MEKKTSRKKESQFASEFGLDLIRYEYRGKAYSVVNPGVITGVHGELPYISVEEAAKMIQNTASPQEVIEVVRKLEQQHLSRREISLAFRRSPLPNSVVEGLLKSNEGANLLARHYVASSSSAAMEEIVEKLILKDSSDVLGNLTTYFVQPWSPEKTKLLRLYLERVPPELVTDISGILHGSDGYKGGEFDSFREAAKLRDMEERRIFLRTKAPTCAATFSQI